MLSTLTETQRKLPSAVVAPSTANLQGMIQEKIRYGELRHASFWAFADTLHLLRIQRWKNNYEATSSFSRGHELPYLESTGVDEVLKAAEEALQEIIPGEMALISRGLALVRDLNEATSAGFVVEHLKDIYEFYLAVCKTINGNSIGYFASVHSQQKLNLSLEGGGHHGSVKISWPSDYGNNLMEAVQSNVRWMRDEERNPTFTEFVVEHIAYLFLANGKQLSSLTFFHEAKFLGTVGFRPISQTYPSLTDPGDGHVFGTTRKNQWMEGAIVHVEHLERPGGMPRTLIESYRIPAILDFARTRLHTAGAMPNTYFTGRALRDSAGSFEQSFIKVVNTTSAACSQAFSLGAAECKIAMDDLSTSQMLAYLKALAGHTIRQPHQYLSCAFNLNWPIVQDDYHDDDGNVLPSRVVSDPFEIAKLAIEIASLGGFDKVTWDGASDSYPSKCIIHQLEFAQWLYLAHRAHELGLTTYTSAGFKFPQICYGVWAGIDGLGIGGAQILRHMDHQSGMHGPYTEENLDRIIEARNNAATHIRGRGVAMLARMDRMFFEGSITDSEDGLRAKLFSALANEDEQKIKELLDSPILASILSMPDDGQRPFTAWAQRLQRHTAANDPVLLKTLSSDSEWDSLMIQLTFALGPYAITSDKQQVPDAKTAPVDVEDDTFDVHLGRVWTSLRLRKTQETTEGYAHSRHDNVVRIKTTPFSSNAESRRSSRRASAVPSAQHSPSQSRRASVISMLRSSSFTSNN